MICDLSTKEIPGSKISAMRLQFKVSVNILNVYRLSQSFSLIFFKIPLNL